MERNAVHREERIAIARRAEKLVEPGETLALGPGVTTLQFARRLAAGSSNVTVITNDLRITTTVGASKNSRVIMLPGGDCQVDYGFA
nr:hypothetical protein [Defluviimonas sediminis]